MHAPDCQQQKRTSTFVLRRFKRPEHSIHHTNRTLARLTRQESRRYSLAIVRGLLELLRGRVYYLSGNRATYIPVSIALPSHPYRLPSCGLASQQVKQGFGRDVAIPSHASSLNGLRCFAGLRRLSSILRTAGALAAAIRARRRASVPLLILCGACGMTNVEYIDSCPSF